MSVTLTLADKVLSLAKKLGVEVSDIETFLHAELEKLHTLAEDNIDAAKEVVTSAPPAPAAATPAPAEPSTPAA